MHTKHKTLVSVLVTLVLTAVLSVTAFASADITGPETVTTGSNIEIKVSGTTKGLSGLIETAGLEFVSVDGGLSDQDMVILLEDFGGMEGTYTYTVTAAEGEPVSFALTQVTESDGQQDIPGPNLTWSGTVGGSFSTTSSAPTATTNAAPTQDAAAAGSDAAGSAAAGAMASDSASQTVSAEPTQGPHTADGSINIWLLCIGAAACAIIAVLVGRRMFRHANK